MLTDEVKQSIQSAYSTFLERKELQARYGQRLMVAEVARTLASFATAESTPEDALAAIEAGTGTGKTVAYSIAAIVLAQKADKQLVISTATVALQEQIVNKDLPDLLLNSGLKFSFALAKGRGRYLCLTKLDSLLQNQQRESATAELFAEEGFSIDVSKDDLQLFTDMMNRYGSGRWDGDRDNWKQVIEDQTWSMLTTDHIQCAGRRCSQYQNCAFYKAREGLDETDVIVTNHDMVLADLALGGGMVLPDPGDTFYIFDEGHHLPEKAINHFAHFTRLRSTKSWLVQTDKALTKLLKQNPTLSGEFASQLEQVPEQLKQLQEQQQMIANALEQQAEFDFSRQERFEKPRYRFEHGVVPEPLREMALVLKASFLQLTDRLSRLHDLLKKALEDDLKLGVDRSVIEQLQPFFGRLYARSEANLGLWTVFSAQDDAKAVPTARWLALVEQGSELDIEVCASPILASGTLRNNLWQRAAAVVLTSATLTALGSFERFRMRSGLPEGARTLSVPSPFNYAEAGVLRVPNLGVDTRDADAHSQAIAAQLPQLLDGSQGSLVLFSSRRQMQDVFELLDADWRERILMQGRLSRQETVEQHRRQVDAGQPSVLFGLASFAEGIDLPGAYCEHVVIAKIPFSVPDAPVEAALAEWIEQRGGNAFMQISVPDASVRLIQACGRLLRSEQDRGQVTIMDRRLVTQRYGRALMDALPPFTRQID